MKRLKQSGYDGSHTEAYHEVANIIFDLGMVQSRIVKARNVLDKLGEHDMVETLETQHKEIDNIIESLEYNIQKPLEEDDEKIELNF